MSGFNRYEVGGRSTDISQIGYSLQYMIKNNFNINEVPTALHFESNDLIDILKDAELKLEELMDLMEKYGVQEK